jgi:hypothetical protein
MLPAIQENPIMKQIEPHPQLFPPPTLRAHACRTLAGGLLAAAAFLLAVPVGAAEVSPQSSLEQWQLRRLNQPSEHERAHEREGNVYIYDGLTDRDVDRALSAHFDRIEYMMFVGTRKTGPTDAPSETVASPAETESPGCM